MPQCNRLTLSFFQRLAPHTRPVTTLLTIALLALCSAVANAATFTVTTTIDGPPNTDAQTSLREAITKANASVGADTVNFAAGLNGTITLTGTQLPLITENLTITGPGASTLAISGNNQSRVFQMGDASYTPTVTISGLTIRNGYISGDGGGIMNYGSLTVQNSTISGNTASQGAGIYSNGALTISSCTINTNSATNNGSGIYSGGALTVQDSAISTNNGGGAGIYIAAGTTIVRNTTLIGNLRDGIYNTGGSALTVQNSTINNNSRGIYTRIGTATVQNSTINANMGRGIDSDSALTVEACTITNNTAGGIYSGRTLTVQNSIISGNSYSGDGGGIRSYNTLTVQNSTISGNSANMGGGIYIASGNTVVQNSTISGNTATISSAYRGGGGISNFGTLTLQNSTVSGNTTPQGRGGGIWNSGTVTVEGVTLSNNSAETGGGIYSYGSSARTTLSNSILATNRGTYVGHAVDDLERHGTYPGTVITNGYNLVGEDDENLFVATGDKKGTSAAPLDPKLGPLQDNGGPTQTHALLSGSPAINAANSSTAPATDQRGYSRNGAADIGAFEFGGKAGSVQFSTASYSVDESVGSATITVTRAGSTDATSVSYATSNGTATAGADYTATSGVLSFAKGQASRTFTVAILNDTASESNETIVLSLSAPGIAALGTPATATLTIVDNDSFTLSGRITTGAGSGVAGASVTRSIANGSAVTVQTDANGNYSFANVPTGSYTLSPARSGYTFAPSGFTNPVTVGPSKTGLNFIATATPAGSYSISGRVANHSGVGIPNVQITRNGGANVLTNANGDYVFTGVASGTYSLAPLITPSLQGVTLYPAYKNVVVKSNVTNQNFTASFSVSGRLSNHSGTGIANVLVQITTGSSTRGVYTDSSGNYKFSDVRSGSYTIVPVLTPAMAGMSFTPATRSLTVGTANVFNQNFIGMFSISGRITSSGGAAIPNVLVRLSDGSTSTSTQTDGNGNYKFGNVRSGTYSITPTLSGRTFTPAVRNGVAVNTLSVPNQNFTGTG